jgi:hypothetical protein
VVSNDCDIGVAVFFFFLGGGVSIAVHSSKYLPIRGPLLFTSALVMSESPLDHSVRHEPAAISDFPVLISRVSSYKGWSVYAHVPGY